jgi:hypothetical protein
MVDGIVYNRLNTIISMTPVAQMARGRAAAGQAIPGARDGNCRRTPRCAARATGPPYNAMYKHHKRTARCKCDTVRVLIVTLTRPHMHKMKQLRKREAGVG